MKNPTTLKEVQAKVQKIKEGLLPGTFIPNSRLYKRQSVLEAEAALQVAKLQKRKVRRADPTECEFARELATKAIEVQKLKDPAIEYLDCREAAEFLGEAATSAKVHHWKRTGNLPYKIIHNKHMFAKSDLIEFNRANGPFFLCIRKITSNEEIQKTN